MALPELYTYSIRHHLQLQFLLQLQGYPGVDQRASTGVEIQSMERNWALADQALLLGVVKSLVSKKRPRS
jgi:hypothetical protein